MVENTALFMSQKMLKVSTARPVTCLLNSLEDDLRHILNFKPPFM